MAIRVSILPAKSNKKEDAQRLQAWKKTGLTSLGRQEFSEVLEDVRPQPYALSNTPTRSLDADHLCRYMRLWVLERQH